MERDGVASVWFGNATSKQAIAEFLRIKYTDEGDSIPSAFGIAFQTEDNHSDFTEWSYRQSATKSIRDLITPNSYSEQILPQLDALVSDTLPEAANAIIVLHQFEYDGSNKQGWGDGVTMTFAGTATFDPVR